MLTSLPELEPSIVLVESCDSVAVEVVPSLLDVPELPPGLSIELVRLIDSEPVKDEDNPFVEVDIGL